MEWNKFFKMDWPITVTNSYSSQFFRGYLNKMIRFDESYTATSLLLQTKPVLGDSPQYTLKPKLRLLFHDKLKEGGVRIKNLFKKSYKNKPLISIVTVIYNGEKHLEQTINSVLTQTYDNVEYIIIDGGSSDKTLDIIKRYESKIDYWISESDDGIYCAMNKGASLCSGEYIAFLNADDWYNLDTIEKVVYQVNKNSDVDYFFGNVNIFSDDKLDSVYKENMSLYHQAMPFAHPSLFIKRSVMLSIGFDEKYKVIADYDFVIKLIKKKYSYIYIETPIANFRTGGVSTTFNLDDEYFRLYTNHFGIVKAIYNHVLRYVHKYIFPIYRNLFLILKRLLAIR